jgi:C4-dicarboxylate-binding protein DctP
MQPIGSRTAAVLAAFVLICCGAVADGRRIRVALQLPESSHLYQNLRFFKQLVEQRTNGAYSIVIVHSGKLVREQDAPAAVANGVVEMAAVSVNQYASAIPAADLFVLPFLFSHPAVLAAATQPGSPVRGPIDQAILERTHARVLWWQSSGTIVMISKGAPLAVPAAIAGKRVRVSTASEGEFVKLCGGIPLVIPAAAHFGAYHSQQLFAGSATIGSLPVRKFWEVANYVTHTRHRTAEFVVTINERLWQSLPSDHRRVIEGAAREAEVVLRGRLAKVEREAQAVAEQSGMRMVALTKAEHDAWKRCAAPVLEAYLERSGQLGTEIMSGFRKLLVEAYRAPSSQPGK